MSRLIKIFFIILQVVFWFDFGFIRYKSTRHKLIVKISLGILAVLKVIASLIIIGSELGQFQTLWVSAYYSENLTYIFILLITPEQNTYRKFLESLVWIDIKVKREKSAFNFDLITFTWLITSSISKLILISTFCKYSNTCPSKYYVRGSFWSVILAQDLPLAIFCLIFHATSVRLVALRKCIKNKTLKPKEAQLVYKHLYDSVESIKKWLDPIFIVSIAVHLPCVMVLIYFAIKRKQTGLDNTFEYIDDNFFGYTNDFVTAIFLLVSVFMPAIQASSLSTEVEKMKVTLEDAIFFEEDASEREDLIRLLSYITTRHFRLSVLKIIHLDSTFPFIVLNFCTTYLIVILQLNHIY